VIAPTFAATAIVLPFVGPDGREVWTCAKDGLRASFTRYPGSDRIEVARTTSAGGEVTFTESDAEAAERWSRLRADGFRAVWS
jgi:hypothetical protein